MNPHNAQNDTPANTGPERAPQFCTCNIGCGCIQICGKDDSGSEADGRRPRTLAAKLQRIMFEHPMLSEYISNDGRSLPEGDEGLEDHQMERHVDAADLGYYPVQEVKRLLGHHHQCNCPVCPYGIKSRVHEWMSHAVGPETPGSMYPEQNSSGPSMASSFFADTPQTTAQLLPEMGGWFAEEGDQFHDDYDYVTAPLQLVPEVNAPRVLDPCIPEKREPSSDDEEY